ncbi:hypothetical protein [Dolichospermum sp. FACHB-1091]|nr:hypothetical protein [Dolichospermum sp. FACHB-1091]
MVIVSELNKETVFNIIYGLLLMLERQQNSALSLFIASINMR